jgi:aerobic-type carbon monoxide dehydrogenase small subunit (CoxS/CutS family)
VRGRGAIAVTKHGPADTTAVGAASAPTATAAAGGPQKYKLSVNGEEHTVKVTGKTPLLYILRDYLDLKGPKFGCGLSECGACAVLLNGVQIRSCIFPVSAVGSEPIVTLEGLAATYHGTETHEDDEEGENTGTPLHPLQQAWIDKQVPQCGYCQSGMMIQAAELLSKNLSPTTDEIKAHMNGHLCRCGTYFRIVDGIHEAARVMRADAKKG